MRTAFLAHLQTSGLIPPGARVLVGYSGGPDSTCLLTLLVGAGYDAVAAHLHHGQRSEADLEMRLCEGYAGELDVPFVGGHADVPGMAERLGVSLEEAGRDARDAFLREAAARLGCDLIATAHTRNDLVETMLFQMARGTGLSGLKGIAAREGVKVRPLLPFSRQETRAFCTEEGLWFHDDPHNTDVTFSRARIRHRVIPELQLVHPGFEEAMLRLAQIAEEEDGFLNGMAAAALEKAEAEINHPFPWLTRDVEAVFERDRIASLPPVLAARAVRLVAATLGASLDRHQTRLVVEGLHAGTSGSVTSSAPKADPAVIVEWTADRVHFRAADVSEPFRFPLTLPGETSADAFGWSLQAWFTEEAVIESDPYLLRVSLDAATVRGTPYFRSAQPSDTVVPFNWARGPRPVGDIFADRRWSQAARRRVPIVCDLVGPIWCPGAFLADRCRVTASTQRTLMMTFGQIGEAT
ncbi:MAG: hypothetical protein AMXMBFR81_28490 [Chthonomonas sp.]